MKIKNILYLTLPMLMWSATVSAAPVSPEEAIREVRNYRTSHSADFPAPKRVAAKPSVAYTSQVDGMTCFYIVNDPDMGGFMIVSGDDRLPDVLGYSYNGEYDEGRISPTMKWWLSEYEKQIYNYLIENPDDKEYKIARARYQDREEIKPLLTTKWNQSSPYNDDCPIDRSTGQLSVTGCVATAMAQVMRFHQWPVHPKGSANGVTFEGTTLDWANMLDTYDDGYSAQEAKAVATLMRQCGASVDMNYSSYESGAYSFDVPVGLTEYFDYDLGMRMHWRSVYTQTEWNNLIYEELSKNRPVYYTGRSLAGGHAFVVDGYLTNNFFHVNWGWGGYQDGYFMLNAMNPYAGGIGSYVGGYNSEQTAIVGIQKNTGKGTRQISMISTGGFVYEKTDKMVKFYISGSSTGQDIIYNPLGYSISVTPGIKIVSTSNPEQAPQYFKAETGSTVIESYHGFYDYEMNVPSMPNGTYRISPAIYTSDGRWEDVGVPANKQTFVTMTVNNGNMELTNEGVDKSKMHKLMVSTIQAVNPVLADTYHAFKLTLINAGKGDFYGKVNISIINESNKQGKGFVLRDVEMNVPAEKSVDFEILSENALSAGTYSVTIFDPSTLEIYTNDLTFDVAGDGNFTSGNADGILIKSISPNFTVAGESTALLMNVKNISYRNANIEFEIKVLDSTGKKVIKSYKPKDKIFVVGYGEAKISVHPTDLNLEPGSYYWVGESNGVRLCIPQPLLVLSAPFEHEGVQYVITDESKKNAMVVGDMYGNYSGDLVIPDYVNGYRVRSIKGDAFTFSDELNSLTVGTGIRDLPAGSFYHSGIKTLFMKSTSVGLMNSWAFADGKESDVLLNSGNPNIYARTKGWNRFKMSAWDIEIPEGENIIITSLKTDPETLTYYTPFYVNSDSSLGFTIEAPADKSVQAEWTIDNGETGSQTFWRWVNLPALNGAKGVVKLMCVDNTGVESIDEDGVFDVFSIDGRVVLRGAVKEQLRDIQRGIYIINNKKYIKR